MAETVNIPGAENTDTGANSQIGGATQIEGGTSQTGSETEAGGSETETGNGGSGNSGNNPVSVPSNGATSNSSSTGAANEKISVSVSLSDVVDTVVTHLSVIGKRAKDVNGVHLFSDITMSSLEKGVLLDLVKSGAETIVNKLAPFCGAYSSSSGESASITFTISAKNWTDPNDSGNDKDITGALEEAIYNYLYNFTLAQYLSIIHPSTGEKYPPVYGSTYTNHCAVIIQNIMGICNITRPSKKSSTDYSSLLGS